MLHRRRGDLATIARKAFFKNLELRLIGEAPPPRIDDRRGPKNVLTPVHKDKTTDSHHALKAVAVGCLRPEFSLPKSSLYMHPVISQNRPALALMRQNWLASNHLVIELWQVRPDRAHGGPSPRQVTLFNSVGFPSPNQTSRATCSECC